MTQETQNSAETDGGLVERRDDDAGAKPDREDVSIDAELPEKGLFDREDYLQMYRFASQDVRYDVLNTLSEGDELSASELGEELNRDGNNLHHHLRKLQDVGLVRNRRRNDRDEDGTYSYYTITSLGEVILTHGIKEGIEKLMGDETAIYEQYRRDDE